MSRVGLFGQISEINNHLYLSGSGVLKPEKLRQKNITCIINATTEEPNAYLAGIDYMKVRVEDLPWSPLDSYFDVVADKIATNRDRGIKTLVHCVAGVSRSASLCIVYLMKHDNLTLRQAYQHVKSARPIIRPNAGFWQQMVDYERRVKGDTDEEKLPDVYVDELRRRQRNAMLKDRPDQVSNNRCVQGGERGPTKGRRSISVGSRRTSSVLPASSAFTYTPTQSVTTSSARQSRFGAARYASHTFVPINLASLTSRVPSRTGHSSSGAKYRSSRNGENIFTNLYNSTHELFYPSL